MSERRPLPYDPKEIKRQLQAQLGSLLPALGITEPIRGAEVTPLNRWRAGSKPDRKAGSFVIWTQGDAAGAWRDYACPDNVAGDVYGLIAYTQGLHAWIDAYWWALAHLNLARGEIRSAAADKRDRARAAQDRLDAENAAKAQDEAKSARLFKLWLGLAPIPGTLAETYLARGRGIPVDRLRRPPRAIRFSPALDHIDESTGEVTTWPAMVTAMTRGPRVVALHRTWLARDGMGKAPVTPAKKMSGPCKGAQMRLSTGPTGLTPEKAAAAGAAGPLAIGEGIETSLSVACARPDYRVWAAGSLSLMGLIEWPACASAIVLLRDNDLKAEALAAFAKVERHWRLQAAGRPLAIAASAVGSDFNDWAKAG